MHLVAAPASLQILVPSAYTVTLARMPHAAATDEFVPMIFATRALLLAPYVVLSPKKSETKDRSEVGSVHGKYRLAYAACFSGLFLVIQQTVKLSARTQGWSQVLDALREPSVRVLGYDFVIASLSAITFASMKRSTDSIRKHPA